MTLLSKNHRILERPFMEFRPFGRDYHGATIQDVSGITVRANLEYLESLATRQHGPQAAQRIIEQLVHLLNERIPDPTYHVTAEFLKNPWNSYSYEFVMFLAEFSIQLSGQPQFHFNLGKEKLLSPIVQILGRPFSVVQIYRMYPYFVEKFTKGSLKPEVISVTNGQAVMRMQFSEPAMAQFGPYLRGCAERICHTTKATIAQVPANMFGQTPATIHDACCIADGADYCEWTFTWTPDSRPIAPWLLGGTAFGLITFGVFTAFAPEYPWWARISLSFIPVLLLSIGGRVWTDRQALQQRGQIIQEQLATAEQQHEELRSAYLKQEHSLVEVRRHVEELTMLHNLALHMSSTLDKNHIMQAGLRAIVESLRYSHAWIALWSKERQVFDHIRAYGGPQSWSSDLESLTIPEMQEDLLTRTLQSTEPIVIEDIQDLLEHGHSATRRLITEGQLQTGVALALVSQHQPLGVLIAGNPQAHAPSIAEQHLLSTIVHQLALALDTALAYDEIEALNVGLEEKVRHRTAELQQANSDLESANTRLKELDQLKSQFLSHCSHELRTPLTSIKGFTENLLQGLVGPLAERQHLYLTRISANANRLTRMIGDLLDLSRIEAGTVRLSHQAVSLPALLEEVTQELIPLTQTKNQQLVVEGTDEPLTVWGDPDRLHQILTNLLHNAYKFTPDEGRITVTVCQNPPQHITLSVADTGTGIPQDAQVNLFQPFYQAHRLPEIGTQGLGLGLSIVKHLVELHEASITVDSIVGQGTAFHIRFPQYLPPPLAPQPETATPT